MTVPELLAHCAAQLALKGKKAEISQVLLFFAAQQVKAYLLQLSPTA